MQSNAYHGIPTTVLQQIGNLNQFKKLKFQKQLLQCRPQIQLQSNIIEQKQQHQQQGYVESIPHTHGIITSTGQPAQDDVNSSL